MTFVRVKPLPQAKQFDPADRERVEALCGIEFAELAPSVLPTITMVAARLLDKIEALERRVADLEARS